MNAIRFFIAVLCLALADQAHCQEMDKELSDLATKLANLTKENGKKKVTVLDFTDLQGGGSELGKYVAEQLTVDMVMVKKDFSVLDRANLRKILDEHKLTATGLVDPENAKKLGQFAGVDALVLGTITPKNGKISLTAKIITTDTAEIVGAAKAEFKADESVNKLLSQPVSEGGIDRGSQQQKLPSVDIKWFGDLGIELRSLQVVNGKDYLLSLNATNRSNKATVWIALDSNDGVVGDPLRSTVTDPEGYEFVADRGDVSGLGVAAINQLLGFQGDATKLIPKESASATIKFYTRPGRIATDGTCRVQLAVLGLTVDGYGKVIGSKVCSVVAEMRTK